MSIKIKNWKLALLALIIFCLFMRLGMWQVSRANEKKDLLASYAARMQHTPVDAKALSSPNDWRFYRAQLVGRFDNRHTVLLDNKTFQGRVGYEVYTPFKARGLDNAILVDRGFVPLTSSRAILPTIPDVDGDVTITGLLNFPPAYHALAGIQDPKEQTWPRRLEFIQLPLVGQILGYSLFPYILMIEPKDPAAFAIEWQIVTMSPERHWGYAVQWFALALTLLILFVALNRD